MLFVDNLTRRAGGNALIVFSRRALLGGGGLKDSPPSFLGSTTVVQPAVNRYYGGSIPSLGADKSPSSKNGTKCDRRTQVLLMPPDALGAQVHCRCTELGSIPCGGAPLPT